MMVIDWECWQDFSLEGITWNWWHSCLPCTIWVILLFDCVDSGISSLHSLSCDAKIFTPYAYFHRSIYMSVLQMFYFNLSMYFLPFSLRNHSMNPCTFYLDLSLSRKSRWPDGPPGILQFWKISPHYCLSRAS